MRVTVISAGSRGDVQPYLALALGLQQRGFEVKFGSNINFAGFAREHGLAFAPIHVDSYKTTQSPEARAWLEATSTLKLALGTLKVVRPVLDRLLADVYEICKDCDLIVYHSFTLPFVYHFGRQLGTPVLPASLYPLATGAHPALSIQPPPVSGRLINLLTHSLIDLFGWQVFRSKTGALLRAKGGRSAGNPYRRMLDGSVPVICGYSRHVVPRPADSGSHIHITGYWFLPPKPDWQPPEGLLSFIQNEKKPLFAGFGSMGNPDKQPETAALIAAAVEAAGQRAILVGGWSGLGADQDLPGEVFPVRSVPFEWLFPQMAAVVHHAGAGTTSSALKAGVPNIAVPHFADNYFWADRIHRLGAGPAPIRRRSLTVNGLAAAIETAVSDPKIRLGAETLGKKIQAERGVETAAEVIAGILGRK